MNTKVWYLPHFEGVYHTLMLETFSNANARMVRMVHNFILWAIAQASAVRKEGEA